MSDDTPETVAPTAIALRREALLPTERSRGLGTVAVVCTMAGVASGLALATTLMAMQVADTMSTRSCPYSRTVELAVPVQRDQGFLGIRYVFLDGTAQVDSVIPGTPAEAIGIHAGDHVLSVNGDRIDSASELQDVILTARPGTRPVITIERDGRTHTLRPQLIAWPAISY